MARSLKVSLQYRSQVKASLLSAGFPTQQDFAEKLGMSRATVSKFLNGKLVGRLNFIEMCHALEFNWEDIADFSNDSSSRMTQQSINSTTQQEDYYIERFPIEEQCFRAILQPGALLRIKAPHQAGKTSLMNKILRYAERKKYQSVFLSLQSSDTKIFENLDIFLKWFCWNIAHRLDLPNRATDENSIYSDHLREKLLFLHQDTKLSQSFKSILLSKEGIDIDLNTAFKLESLGLVKLKNNQAIIPLKLYRDYFIERLNLLNCD